jgi:molecular chaperone HscB
LSKGAAVVALFLLPSINEMKLESTDFELFDIPARFALDAAALSARWRALQGEVHPDRFAIEGAAAQRVAMQWAVRVNEAYERLKDPLRRAAYLCELNGAPIEAENNTAMPTEFLVQQMQWREALDEAPGVAEVQALASNVTVHHTNALQRLQLTIDEGHDYARAAQQVRALMFVERFASDVDERLQALGQ